MALGGLEPRMWDVLVGCAVFSMPQGEIPLNLSVGLLCLFYSKCIGGMQITFHFKETNPKTQQIKNRTIYLNIIPWVSYKRSDFSLSLLRPVVY